MDVLLDTLKRKIEALPRLGDEVADEVARFQADLDLPEAGREAHIREARSRGEATLRGLLREIEGLFRQNEEAIEAGRRASVGTAEARSVALQLLKDDPTRLDRLLRSGDRHILAALRYAAPLVGLDSPELYRSIDERLVEAGAEDEAARKSVEIGALPEQADVTGRFALSWVEGRPSAPERRLAMAHARNDAEAGGAA
jgi:hypothetical protein